MFKEKQNIHSVHVITDDKQARIRDFLQGAVYCWCKNRKGEWFSMRDLMGGENYFWQGTPLIELYNAHANSKSTSNSVKEAGKSSGRLLKQVIEDDKRTFETRKDEEIRKYKWIF